ncbi:MAG: SDR family oxidoreductase [Steroidobacteraceae bacterium]
MDLELSGKRAFAAERARVAINYVVHAEQTAQLADRLRAGGTEVLALEADVSRADAVAAMFHKIDAAWGGYSAYTASAAGKHDLISKIAIGRIGEPEDVAGMAVALASDVASCWCSLACRW